MRRNLLSTLCVVSACAPLGPGCTHAPGLQPADISPPVVDPRESRCRAGKSTPASHDCFDAGNAYDRGADGHPLRQDKAIELYALGCNLRPGDPSCGALKNEIISLQLTASRRGEALGLLEAACHGGSLDLCNDLASAYRDGVGGAPQPSKAAALFARSCDSSDADGTAADRALLDAAVTGCHGLATLLRSGRAGVEKDEPRASRAEARAAELTRPVDTVARP